MYFNKNTTMNVCVLQNLIYYVLQNASLSIKCEIISLLNSFESGFSRVLIYKK